MAATKRKPMKKYPTGRAGNYAAPVDTTGMDPAMKATLVKKPGLGRLNKVERDYLKGTGGRASAEEAIRRARKANKKGK